LSYHIHEQKYRENKNLSQPYYIHKLDYVFRSP